MVLAKDVWVQCGRQRIEWDAFCDRLLDTYAQFQEEDLLALSHMREARRKYRTSLTSDQPALDLFSILLARRGFKTSDPKDMVYGHLAVAVPTDPLEEACNFAKVDYNKNVVEVYVDAAIYVANSSSEDDRRLFSNMELKDSSIRRPGLPSWVPDWSLDLSCYLRR